MTRESQLRIAILLALVALSMPAFAAVGKPWVSAKATHLPGLFMIDAGVVLDTLSIDHGGLAPGHPGPLQTADP